MNWPLATRPVTRVGWLRRTPHKANADGCCQLWQLPAVAAASCGCCQLWLLPAVAATSCGCCQLWLLPAVAAASCDCCQLWLLPAVAAVVDRLVYKGSMQTTNGRHSVATGAAARKMKARHRETNTRNKSNSMDVRCWSSPGKPARDVCCNCNIHIWFG